MPNANKNTLHVAISCKHVVYMLVCIKINKAKMRKIIKILIICVLLSSCSMNEIPDKLIPKEADKFAKNYINILVNDKLDFCYNKLETLCSIRIKKKEHFILNFYRTVMI